MTQPGGGGNDINLAALWIPVMPETSHMGEEMKQAGREAKKKFEEGFNSGSSPESLGQSYGSKLADSIGKELKHFELPYGMGEFFEKFSADVDQKLVAKLKGEATQALERYKQAWDDLQAAQARAKKAEDDITLAQSTAATNRAQVILPLMAEQARATKEVTTAQTNAGAALDEYKKKNSALAEETSKAVSGSQILATAMGVGIVAAAQLAVTGVEHLVEAVAEGFKKSIEITAELAKQAVELGETYEHIGIQVQEFSSATGEHFEELESHAQSVFGTLDVAGKNTGQVMAQFASMLDAEPGPALDRLVKHFEELQGRYTDLRSNDLASVFVAFKTPLEETDSALASLLQSARNSGQDLGQLSSALSGDVAYTLKEAGLNIEQAGAFTGKLLEMGTSGRSVVMGLNTAMKDFGKEGLSFADGMKLAGQRLQELGDTAEGQDLAEKLFGTRHWAVAKSAVEEYLQIVEKAPDAFNANASSIDEFTRNTETLDNKLEQFKHHAMETFKPLGDAAKNFAVQGLNAISNWFDQHHTQIIGDIKTWGDRLIDFLPTLQEWAVDALRIGGEFLEGLLYMLQPVATTAAAAGAGMLALSGHFKEAKDLLVMTANFDPSKIGDMLNTAADKIAGIHIDTQGIKADFDAAADSALRIPPSLGNTLGQQGLPAPGGPGEFPPPDSAPGAPGGAPSNTHPWFPGAPGGGPPRGPNDNGPHGAIHHADWDAIAQKESGGRWNEVFTTGVPLGGGLQIKPETWYEFGGLAFTQYAYQATKEQQIEIAERILNGWGTVKGQGPQAWENGKTYVEKKALGGAPGRSITQGSGADDDVAALLKRGEYVWDTDTVDKHGWLIKALHQGAMGFDQGGGLDTQGAQVDTIAVARAAQALFGINDIGMYRSPDGYNEHASGEAADVMVGNNKRLGDAVAQYFLEHATQFGVQYVLWQQAQWNPDGSSSKMSDRGSPTANHLDHVHIRTLGGGFPQGQKPRGFAAPSTGQTSNEPSAIAQYQFGAGGGDIPNDPYGMYPGGNPGYAGVPGQYGGYGAYGAETYDQQVEADKRVRDAQQRAADMDEQIRQKQQHIDDLNKQIAEAGQPTKTGALGLPVKLTPDEEKAAADKKKRLQEELDNATSDMARATRERADQDSEIATAERKRAEDFYKAPEKAKTQKPVGAEAFSQLGSSFLSGIGQELGFGDLFSKPPWEWGAVKLLTGAAGWAMNTANAWADEIGKGHTGMTGFQPIANWDSGGSSLFSGLAGSLGINLPQAALPQAPGVSSGPNIVTNPSQGMPTPYGQLGPAPGPVNIDQSIHVSSDVDSTKVLAPVQELQNSNNASLHGQTGGLPK